SPRQADPGDDEQQAGVILAGVLLAGILPAEQDEDGPGDQGEDLEEQREPGVDSGSGVLDGLDGLEGAVQLLALHTAGCRTASFQRGNGLCRVNEGGSCENKRAKGEEAEEMPAGAPGAGDEEGAGGETEDGLGQEVGDEVLQGLDDDVVHALFAPVGRHDDL